MKRSFKFSKQFKKDYRKIEKSGKLNIEKLKKVMQKLMDGHSLESSYEDHELKGGWKGYRDCHVEGDWLLIYKIVPHSNGLETVIFSRTGNHSNLFK